MNLPEFGVKRAVTTVMIFLAMIILGLVSFAGLGIDLMPEIEIPTIGVVTKYEGAGPQEVESRITKLLEAQLSTVPNLDKLESISQDDLSVITLRFDWGTNLDAASNDVRDKIGLVKPLLPKDAQEPYLFKFDISMLPILFMGFTAEESFPQLYHIIDREVCDVLKTIPGVAAAEVRGGLERQISVDIDRQRLEARNLSILEVVNAIHATNLDLPGGHLKSGRMDYLVRTPMELQVEEVEKVVIGIDRGSPIYLKDVARVKDDFKELTQEVRVDKRQGLYVLIQKQSGANTVAVTDRVLAAMKEIKKNLPADVRMSVVRDTAHNIRLAVARVSETGILALILVVFVVLLFLRNFASSLIIAVSLPTSLIVTFALMYFAGYTLNVLTLCALTIAIGLVVDDAIVVLENIHRHQSAGERPRTAAIFAPAEVGNAVIAATLTMVAVFFPIVFVKGVSGILFRQMSFVIILALLASLASALILVPMLSSRFLRLAEHQKKKRWSRLKILGEKTFEGLDNKYRNILGWALHHRKMVIGGGAAVLGLSVFLLPLLGTEFMPEADQGHFRINLELAVGTRAEETEKVARAVEAIMIRHTPELQTYLARWGYGRVSLGTFLAGKEGTHVGMVMGRLVPQEDRLRSNKEIVNALRDLTKDIPGATIRYSTEDPMSGLVFGGGRAFQVEVWGWDLEEARRVSYAVARTLSDISGLTDVEISREEGKPELRVKVDRDKASLLGLTVATIANTVKIAVGGEAERATKFRAGGEEFDIYPRLREEDRQRIEDLGLLPIKSPAGKMIRLSNVARIVEETGPMRIERKGQQRIIKVMADIYGRDLGSVVEEAKAKLAHLALPPGFSLKFGGAREEQEKAFRWLLLSLVLGLVLVYMVMAAQFESLRDPLVMYFAIPFAMVGVIWTLLLTGHRLSVPSFIGLIMLVGIVAKNGIILIEYINILRARGMSVREAVMTGGRTRLRPVLMTAFTTFFGLLPLALRGGEGSEFWRPLAAPAAGGLLISTFITLLFVPTLYAVLEERMERKKARKANQEISP
ncbi:MAG: efflux RND transporter permease subunit [Deltaproteobacteria bacterium]|nr:efflux RND transporter permease subunit [Deltaproteobacteria bacterium]